jgi:DNA-binding IclR family transcriptional regulator
MSAATEGYCVTRTLRALEALATRPLSSSELGELIGVHERTARRLLGRLARECYAVRLGGPRNRYALTGRVVELAARGVLNRAARLDHPAPPADADDTSTGGPRS